MVDQVLELSRRGWPDFFRGFAFPFRALGVVFSTPRLRTLTLAVAGVTVLSLVALSIGLWHGAPALVDWLWTAPNTWWGATVRGLLVLVTFTLGFLVGATTLPMTVAAPLMDPLSIQAERALGHQVVEEGGFGRLVREVALALVNAVWRIGVFLAGQALLVPLLLLPVVGGPLFTAASWTWASVWVAAQYLDVPMARHLHPFREELALVRGRFALCLGFGAAVSLMLWVPLLNFFFVPVAVVAATMLFRGLVGAGELPDRTVPSRLSGSRGAGR